MPQEVAPIHCCNPSSERLSKESLYAFLCSVDYEFSPNLSSKVDLCIWCDKVMSQASYVAYYNQHQLVGLLVFYCNDLENKRGYISLLGVDQACRGRGYARQMLSQTIDCIRVRAFSVIGVHSNNPTAINLYRSFGFKEVGLPIDGRYYMELKL